MTSMIFSIQCLVCMSNFMFTPNKKSLIKETYHKYLIAVFQNIFLIKTLAIISIIEYIYWDYKILYRKE